MVVNAVPPHGCIPELLRIYNAQTHSRLCGCAGRSYSSYSTSQLPQSHGNGSSTRTRRVHPASSWHQSRAGMSLPRAPAYLPNLVHSDGKRTSNWAHSRRARSGLCRPICADCAACQQHARCALRGGCMCPAGGCWIAPGKPPPAAHPCGTTAIVRIRPRLQPRMASSGSSSRCAGCTLRVCWAGGSTAGDRGSTVEHSVRMRDWPFKASK